MNTEQQTQNYQTQTTQTMGQTLTQTQQTMQQAGQTAQAQYIQTAQTTQFNQVAGQAATTMTADGQQAMQYQQTQQQTQQQQTAQQVARQETMQMNPTIASFSELYDQQGAAEAKTQQLTTTANQKGGVGTAILIVILFLALIGLVGYILYTKGVGINNDNGGTNGGNANTTINISIDDEKVLNSYEKMTSSYFDMDYIKKEYFVGKDITAKDISNAAVYDVTATQVLKDKNMDVLQDGATFTADELNKKIDELFGEDYEFATQAYGCPIFDFNEATQTYSKSELGCGFEFKEDGLVDQVVMAEEHDNELDVYVRVLYTKTNPDTQMVTYFSDYGKTNVVKETYSGDVLSLSDISKGSLYKLTFAENAGTFQFKTAKLVS